MNLGKRVDKLEGTGSDGLVILIVDEFPQDDSEPVIRDAYVAGRHFENGGEKVGHGSGGMIPRRAA